MTGWETVIFLSISIAIAGMLWLLHSLPVLASVAP